MGHLALHLLGTPEIRLDGHPVKFATRKAQAMLIYLALEGGLHSREKLTALFWPESDSKRGRAAFRNTLRRLRDALGNVGRRYLLTEGDALGLDREADIKIDVQYIEVALRAVREGNTVEAAAALQRIPPGRSEFLDGFALGDASDFDDWASFQRGHWFQRLDLLLDRLSQSQFDSGQIEPAIDTAMRWIAHNPLNESAYCRLMRLHVAGGNTDAALRAYQMCRATLAVQLYAEPSAETEALAEGIRAGAGAAGMPVRPSAREAQHPSTLDLPLAGRVGQFSQLVAAYIAASRGKMQVVVLEGEAGIGKTRLASDFLAWVAAHGGVAIRGRAYEMSGRLAYQPILEALNSRLAGPEDPRKLHKDSWLVELSRLLPALRERYPDLPEPPMLNEASMHTRLFDAAAQFFEVYAQKTPLVLFFDDVQWADSASLDLIYYLAQRWTQGLRGGRGIQLLLTLRSEAQTPDTATWLVRLARNVPLLRLYLAALTEDETQQIVRGLAGHKAAHGSEDDVQNAAAAFGAWLYSETRGQPFFMQETIKALMERGLLKTRRAAGGSYTIDFGAIPQDMGRLQGFVATGVREVILARLARLSPTAFGLLAAGAILGGQIAYEQMCQVADLRENEGLPALDELVNGHLLVEGEGYGAEHPYLFSHDKIRDVVYGEAGAARRRVFHRRAFEVLCAGGAPAAELSRHALAANLVREAFEYSVRAGDDAARVYALTDAFAHYQCARDILHQGGERSQIASPDAAGQFYLKWGRACELNNELGRAREIYQEMASLAESPALRCMALNRLATLAMWDGFDLAQANALLTEALGIAERNGDKPGLAETEWNLAQAGVYSDSPETLTHARRAHALARELNDGALIARSLVVLAHAFQNAGEFRALIPEAEEALTFYRRSGDRAMQTECLTLLSLARCAVGEIQAGLEIAREARRISLEIGNQWGQVFSAFALAGALVDVGAYEDALELSHTSVHQSEAIGLPQLQILSFTASGLAHMLLGARQNAVQAIDQALEVVDRLGRPRVPVTMYSSLLCQIYALLGHRDKARHFARQAAQHREYPLGTELVLPHHVEIAMLLEAGNRAAAEELLAHLAQRSQGVPRSRALYLLACSAYEAWRGAYDQAAVCLIETIEIFEGIGAIGYLPLVLQPLTRLCEQLPDHKALRETHERIIEAARQLAAGIRDMGWRRTFQETCGLA